MTSLMPREDYLAKVGEKIGVSEWHVIDQKRIDVFADATEDHQFIHIDPVKARDTPFGATIAHGFLTASMLSVFAYEALPRLAKVAMGVNYGFDKLRFVSPVKSGSRVRGHFTLAEAKMRNETEMQVKLDVSVEIEGQEKPAIVAEWLTMTFFAS